MFILPPENKLSIFDPKERCYGQTRGEKEVNVIQLNVKTSSCHQLRAAQEALRPPRTCVFGHRASYTHALEVVSNAIILLILSPAGLLQTEVSGTRSYYRTAESKDSHGETVSSSRTPSRGNPAVSKRLPAQRAAVWRHTEAISE